MEKQIKEWKIRIDRVTSEVKAQFSGLNSEQLNWKPSANKWSIAEVLERLILVNASYKKVLEDAANGTSNPGWTAKIGFLVTFSDNVIYKSVELTRKKKISTFSIWEPSSSNVSQNVIADFLANQEKIKALIRKTKHS